MTLSAFCSRYACQEGQEGEKKVGMPPGPSSARKAAHPVTKEAVRYE
jgi:hypothetical protein